MQKLVAGLVFLSVGYGCCAMAQENISAASRKEISPAFWNRHVPLKIF
jgi:hypothetical protein